MDVVPPPDEIQALVNEPQSVARPEPRQAAEAGASATVPAATILFVRMWAIAHIVQSKGTHFDPAVVDAFVNVAPTLHLLSQEPEG